MEHRIAHSTNENPRSNSRFDSSKERKPIILNAHDHSHETIHLYGPALFGQCVSYMHVRNVSLETRSVLVFAYKNTGTSGAL